MKGSTITTYLVARILVLAILEDHKMINILALQDLLCSFCLEDQKAKFRPSVLKLLHSATFYNLTIKTVFLLAQATAHR